jgi:hypothetical protein
MWIILKFPTYLNIEAWNRLPFIAEYCQVKSNKDVIMAYKRMMGLSQK